MKFLGIVRRGAAFALAGTVGLVGFSLFTEGRLQSETPLTSRRLSTGAPEGDGATATVQECTSKDGGVKAILDLTPTVNTAVEFRCSDDSSLHPGDKDPLKIYHYDAAKKSCDTANAEALATAFTGATLTKKEAQGGSRAGGKSPVYAFKYTAEPNEDKHLCYTCNKPAAGSPEHVRQGLDGEAAQETVACTVYIKVSKKEQEKTTTTSSTSAPTTSSGAHAMPAAIFSAVGGLLAVVLRT